MRIFPQRVSISQRRRPHQSRRSSSLSLLCLRCAASRYAQKVHHNDRRWPAAAEADCCSATILDVAAKPTCSRYLSVCVRALYHSRNVLTRLPNPIAFLIP